jgi:hypothetical protein
MKDIGGLIHKIRPPKFRLVEKRSRAAHQIFIVTA